MDIRVLASGSSGNAYYVGGESPLLLEAGIPFRRIQEALNFKTFCLGGCLITHEHMDHAKAVKDMLKAGIDCCMSQGTADALGIYHHHRLHIVRAGVQFQFYGWTVMPFATKHDAAEPLGFLMQSGENKLLYATDTEYIPHTFQGLNYILVECNFSMEIVKQRLGDGELNRALWDRILRNHLSLETLIDFLKANDLSELREIWLLHLSNNNSDAGLFKRKIQEVTGKVVKVA